MSNSIITKVVSLQLIFGEEQMRTNIESLPDSIVGESAGIPTTSCAGYANDRREKLLIPPRRCRSVLIVNALIANLWIYERVL